MVHREHVEIEWQFDAPDLRAVRRWLLARPADAYVVVESGERRLDDTYYDTNDWRLFYAGYALRVRTRDGAEETTLKALTLSGNRPATRAEFTEEGGLDVVLQRRDGPTGVRLNSVLRGEALRPLAVAVTHRRSWTVRAGGAYLADIALDNALVGPPGAPATRWRCVEVEEIAAGGLDVAGGLVAELRATCGLTPARHSKFEAALKAAGRTPSLPDLGPTAVDPSDRASDRAYAVLRRRFGDLLEHEAGTALGDDPEQLHQMRVATRRLRSVLRVFDSVLPAAVLATRAELRWLARRLGAVRDLDVQLEYLEGVQAACDEADAAVITPLIAHLRQSREQAREALLGALISDRYRTLTETLRTLLRSGPPERARGRTSAVLRRGVVRDRYRQFRRAARQIDAGSAAEEYHALRIHAKQLRYALELFDDLDPRATAAALRSLRRLQDLLGEHQDLAIQDGDLRAMVADRDLGLPPESLLMCGRLLERHHVRSIAIREAFPEVVSFALDETRRVRRRLKR